MCEQERLGLFYFWREVGRRMQIREIPESYDELERYNVDYEQRHFKFSESSRRVGTATVEMFAAWFPRGTRWLVRRSIYAVLDDPVLAAFGFPRPSRAMRAICGGALKLRAFATGLLPRRRRPRLRTELKRPTYPSGYVIEQLGPPDRSGSG